MIKVLIADDHALVREGLGAMLKLHEGIEVVGEAADGQEAIEKAAATRPDVVLMDIAMPGLGGLEATLSIKKKQPGTKVLILSQYDDVEYLNRFLKAGISGYILKSAIGSELVSAIKAVAAGGYYLYPKIATCLVDGYLGKKRLGIEDPYERITDREKQVLKLLAEGKSHKEIAGVLDISIKTVIAHQTNITEKLDIHSRAELIRFAIKNRVINIEEM